MGERPVPKRSNDQDILRGATQNRGGKGKIVSDMLNRPKVFVFVAGGLSHHEIVSLERLQTQLDTRIVPGSDQIISPNDYLSNIETLNKKETLIQFKEDVMGAVKKDNMTDSTTDYNLGDEALLNVTLDFD